MAPALARKPSFTNLNALEENPGLAPYKEEYIAVAPKQDLKGTPNLSSAAERISQNKLKGILGAVETQHNKEAQNLLNRAITLEQIQPSHIAIAATVLEKAKKNAK